MMFITIEPGIKKNTATAMLFENSKNTDNRRLALEGVFHVDISVVNAWADSVAPGVPFIAISALSLYADQRQIERRQDDMPDLVPDVDL